MLVGLAVQMQVMRSTWSSIFNSRSTFKGSSSARTILLFWSCICH
jgi:hypothetical protein